jgi:hypothetical protein
MALIQSQLKYSLLIAPINIRASYARYTRPLRRWSALKSGSGEGIACREKQENLGVMEKIRRQALHQLVELINLLLGQRCAVFV